MENDFTYLTSVLQAIRYQKEKTISVLKALEEVKSRLVEMPLKDTLQVIENLNIPQRMAPVHDIETILSHLPPDLSKRYRQKFDLKEMSKNKNKLKINWSMEEIELFEKSLLIQFPIDRNHKVRLENIAKHLPSKSIKQIQVRMNKHYMRLLKENKPLSGARYIPVIPEKKRGRPSKSINSSYVSFSDAQQKVTLLDHNQIHYGIMCEVCNCDPIVGKKYRCEHCGIDLCEDCYSEETVNHLEHRWTIAEKANNANITDEYAYVKGIWGGNKHY